MMTNNNFPSLENYYQQIPFPEYSNITAKRMDSNQRYVAIKMNCIDFHGKTLIDVGCAEGFFMWKFIHDGGKFATGIEIEIEKINFITDLSKLKKYPVICQTELPRHKHDIAFYLDLYGHNDESVKMLDKLVDICDLLFVSNSGDETRFENLKNHLDRINIKYFPIYKGYSNRTILKCEKVLNDNSSSTSN